MTPQSHSRVEPPTRSRELWWGAAIAAAAILAFYGATMARRVGLGDTALLIDEMMQLKITSHVNNHRIAVLFGYLLTRLPFDEIAFGAHLTSVLFGSAAMITCYFVAHRTLGRVVPALLATFAVSATHSMWWHSTLVENYAINAFALMSVLLLLLKDEERGDSVYYYAACVVAGLAVVNHVQMGFLAPVLVVYATYQRKKQSYGLLVRWLKMVGFYLLGLAPYLVVLARDMVRATEPTKVLYWAIGGDFTARMFDTDASVFRMLLTEFAIQFPSPMLLFAALGVNYVGATRWYGKTSVAMSIGFLVNTIFFMQFHTWDKFAFLLPSFLILAYWGIVGMRAALEWAATRARAWRWAVLGAAGACVVVPPLFYARLPKWGEEPGFWYDRFNNQFTRNTHDCATYIANPDKSGYDDIDAFSRVLFEKLPEGALFLDDDARTYYPLHDYYQKYLHMRRDVRVVMINSWGFGGWGVSERTFVAMALGAMRHRSVFLVSRLHPHTAVVTMLAEHGFVARRFALDDQRWIYRVEPIDPASPLTVVDAEVGGGWDRGRGYAKTVFGAAEPVMVNVELAPNPQAMEAVFEWHDPTGEIYFRSDPFTVPRKSTSLWSALGGTEPRAPGRWSVALLANGQWVGAAHFEIEDGG